MAADRTLMAWVRTAIPMIGFGFTLYKFLQYIHQQKPEGLPSLDGPRNLGLAFIGLGLVSLVILAAAAPLTPLLLFQYPLAELARKFFSRLVGL
jgi:putative membrane protein